MRVIVPLKGLLGARYGLALGFAIPLLSFYFIQLRPKNSKPLPSPPHPHTDEASETTEVVEVEEEEQAPIADRALSIVSIQDAPYGLAGKELNVNAYNASLNPRGCIDLGLSENKLSLDLIQDWLSKWSFNSMDLVDTAGYAPFLGLKSLRTVLAKFMGVVMGGRVKFEASQIVVTAGATPAIEILCFCLAQPGDAFLIPTPYYGGYERDIKWRSQVELIPVPCYSSTDFRLTQGALESTYQKLIKRGINVRGVLITNPSNPVGYVLDQTMLASILAFVTDKKIHLIVNEIYAACVMEGYKFTSIAEVLELQPKCNRSYVHILYGLSKDLGISGFRVGALYSWNKQVVEAGSLMARFCTVSTPTQELCTSLLGDANFMSIFLAENRKRITERHHKVVFHLEKAGIRTSKCEGGLFCWIDLRRVLRLCNKEEEMKLWKHLLYKIGLHLNPGFSCCCNEPGWFRLCFATCDDSTLSVALQRLENFMQRPEY